MRATRRRHSLAVSVGVVQVAFDGFDPLPAQIREVRPNKMNIDQKKGMTTMMVVMMG